MRWDQYTDDAMCVDEEVQPDGLIELLPLPVTMDEQEPALESDTYLDSLLTEDLSDADHDDHDIDDEHEDVDAMA